MIFGWKKSEPSQSLKGVSSLDLFRKLIFSTAPNETVIRLEHVSLPPTIQNLSVQMEAGSWVILAGDDGFAKALFCDLCFQYIFPVEGRITSLKASEVSFLGRSNTTYGKTLLDHLTCGVRESSKELLEFVAKHVLSSRFERHLNKEAPLEFAHAKAVEHLELDERDFLEIAEANLLLQKRSAAIIDTTSDFYQIALEQGFQHSESFLLSGKTLFWIVDESLPLPGANAPWKDPRFSNVKKISLYFPAGSRADHIN